MAAAEVLFPIPISPMPTRVEAPLSASWVNESGDTGFDGGARASSGRHRGGVEKIARAGADTAVAHARKRIPTAVSSDSAISDDQVRSQNGARGH